MLQVIFKLDLSSLVTCNGLTFGEEPDFEALNHLPALNLIRNTMVDNYRDHLHSQTAFLQNASYPVGFYFVRKYSLFRSSPPATKIGNTIINNAPLPPESKTTKLLSFERPI